MSKDKVDRGITLIALVITVIILLILAGVAINLMVGEKGIFSKAKYSAEQYNNASLNEAEMLNSLVNSEFAKQKTVEVNKSNILDTSCIVNVLTFNIDNIREYSYYFKKTGENEYTQENLKEATKTFVGLTPGTKYDLYVRVYDNTGSYFDSSVITFETVYILGNAAQVGNYIAYNAQQGNYNNLWRVFTNVSGAVSIISDDIVEKLVLSSESGYNNGISLLNNIANKYINSKYANVARSVNENDISKLTSAGLLNIKKEYWLATQYYYNDYYGGWDYYLYMKYIDANALTTNGLLYYTDGGVSVGTIVRTLEYGVRPIIELKPNLAVTGDGSKDNPWKFMY